MIFRLLVVVTLFFCHHCYSQEQVQIPISSSKQGLTYDELDTLTKVRLADYYSINELQQLKENDDKLIKLNYVFSGSFEVKAGQTYSLDDYLRIDISLYDSLRTDNEIVEVFDQNSGLYLLLDSEMQARQKLPERYFDLSIPDAPTGRLQN